MDFNQTRKVRIVRARKQQREIKKRDYTEMFDTDTVYIKNNKSNHSDSDE